MSSFASILALWILPMPVKDAKYRYLTNAVVIPVSILSCALCVGAVLTLPWWAALPSGIAAIALGFLLVLRIMNRILPKKFPPTGDL